MASTSTFPPPVSGSAPVEVPRTNGVGPLLHRIGASLIPLRIATKNNGVFACSNRSSYSNLALAEGPSCIFVGPIETARKETLEALYRQARDAYYSGEPLIVDDMFDKVELKLRWYGSKSVVKYPRCSLRRQSTYADAEEDHSQVLALASVWTLLLAFGGSAFLVPTIYTFGLAYQEALTSRFLSSSSTSASEFLSMLNGALLVALGSLIGYPIASASVGALRGLWRNNLVALKGACPNCTEEVYAFVRADQSNQVPHRADCHVCQCTLEFRTKVEFFVIQRKLVIEFHPIAIPADLGYDENYRRVVDILVNNAAEQYKARSMEEIDEVRLERVFRTNIFAYFFMTRHVLKYMKEGSCIICPTSVVAYKVHPKLIDYAATKGVMVAFVRSMALHLARRGIRVNGVAPGPVWTPLIPASFSEEECMNFGKEVPMGRAAQPHEVAPAYVFLACLADASYITG